MTIDKLNKVSDGPVTERWERGMELRMAGAVPTRELNDMEISAVEVAEELRDNGFEVDDIVQYLQMKVEAIVRNRVR